MTDGPQGLGGWVRMLSERGMPIFARTAREIAGMTSRDESSAAELARVILQDPSMTARMLRVSNSPYYNPAKRTISTVSRAVVMLGFDVVRSICFSIAAVETLAQGPQRERVLAQMTRSFHAAVQARAFAIKRKDPAPEEVFIAALLHNLGEMAFWCFSGDTAPRLIEAMNKPGYTPVRAEDEVIGFRLQHLTRELARDWSLGELLQNTLEGKQNDDPRVSNVVLGHELAECAERGWDTPETRQLMARIAETLYLPVDAVNRMVQGNAREAVKTAACYGVSHAGRYIALPRAYVPETPETQAETDIEAEAEAAGQATVAEFPQPDAQLQLRILRELSGLVETRPNVNLLLEMVLEGLFRGVGMDRTLFALLSADRRQLKARYALGWERERLLQQFVFPVTPDQHNLFAHVLQDKDPLWIESAPTSAIARLLTPRIAEMTRGAPFFVTPIVVNGQSIGVFYADRQPSGRELQDEDFGSFRHFCQQANLALAFLARRDG